MKRTKTRRAVEAILQDSKRPMSMTSLWQLIRRKNSSVAFSTIYRLVTRLEADGKIERIDWRERGSHFEWTDRAHHHHLVCRRCGVSIDVDDTVFVFDRKRAERQTGYKIDKHCLKLEGLCPDCQSN